MSPKADEIVSAAIQLPESDRMAIVSRLLETMGDHENLSDLNDTDFIDEIRQRRDNPGDIVPWSSLRDEE